MSNLIYNDRKSRRASNEEVFILTLAEYKDNMGGIYTDEVKNLFQLIENESSIVSDLFYRIYKTKDDRTFFVKEFWDLEEAKIFFESIVDDQS